MIVGGVETEEQSRFVAYAGCDILQGCYFHAPMSAQELGRLFAADDIWREILIKIGSC